MNRRRVPYSPTEVEWLEANRMMVLGDYHRAFVAAFGRTDVTYDHLKSLRTRKGWKVGRDGSRYKGRRRKFSEAEMAWLRDNATLLIRDYHQRFCSAFGRDDVTITGLNQLRKREGFRTGRTGQFEKGLVPFNKGKRCEEGKGGRHPNAQRTQFKKGNLPHNTHYLGHERVSKDGYVEISIDERNPHTGFERRYVLKHKHLWEKANGPVPEGHCLKCLDGNRLNTDPTNWELIPRAMQPYLQGRYGFDFDGAEPELRPTMMAVAKAKHAARVRKAVSQ